MCTYNCWTMLSDVAAPQFVSVHWSDGLPLQHVDDERRPKFACSMTIREELPGHVMFSVSPSQTIEVFTIHNENACMHA